MKLKDFKTRTKLILCFGTILVFATVIGIVGIYSLKEVKNKQDNLMLITNTKTDLLTARLAMRTFSQLRDTQYLNPGLTRIESATAAVSDLIPELTIQANIDLANSYKTELLAYHALMLENRDAIVAQETSITKRAEINGEITNTFQKLSLPENNKVNFYFTLSRLDGALVIAYSKIDFFTQATQNIELAIKESERAGYAEITPLLNNYNSAMSEFMAAYQVTKNTEQKLMEKGTSLIKIVGQIEGNTNNFVKGTYRSAILFIIILILITLSLSIFVSYNLTKYLTTMIKKGATLAKVYAEGDLSYKVSDEDLTLKDELGDLTRSMVDMGKKIKNVIADVLASADNVAMSSVQVSNTSQLISQGASEQASSVEEVASSMEEMSSNIQQNTDNAMQTEKIAAQVLVNMEGIAQKSEKATEANRNITTKINIINEIAFQTNILALNAAVEAARAGEYGRGFAVVASEVRKLAEHSKSAAEEIVSLSKLSLQLSEEVKNKMAEIMPDIERTSKLVNEITAASSEQNNGAEQINNALQQLNNVTQQNAAASEELATNAEEMNSQAEMLKEQVSFFTIEQ